MVTLTVGAATSVPGQMVVLPIHLDTQGILVRGIQVNISFDPAPFANAFGTVGTSLPTAWFFASNTPSPGDMRFSALDTVGLGAAFNGPIFVANFFIASTAIAQTVSVRIALQEVIDQANTVLPVTPTDGLITIATIPTPVLVSNPATLMVTQAEAVAINISPAIASIAIGTQKQYTAICTLTDGTTRVCTVNVQWVSSAPTVATIDATGLATGLGVGDALITAQLSSPILP